MSDPAEDPKTKTSSGPSRDLFKAKKAYAKGDLEAARRAHGLSSCGSNVHVNVNSNNNNNNNNSNKGVLQLLQVVFGTTSATNNRNHDDANNNDEDQRLEVILKANSNTDSSSGSSAGYGKKQEDSSEETEIIMSSPESHNMYGGDYIKSFVFGGLDGIITTFAIVAAVAGTGGKLGHEVVILMGLANLVADAISMGFGDFLSEKAELDFIKHERAREEWELENFPEGEIREMIELYEGKGFSHNDAALIIQTMAKNKDFFIDHMCVQELGVMPPSEDDEGLAPAKKGLVTFLAFMLFGSVPVIVYAALGGFDWGEGREYMTFVIACVATEIVLFALGYAKQAFMADNCWAKVKSGGFMMLNGTLAAGASFLIGYVVEQQMDLNQCGA